jgi:Rrf2 family protein
MVRSRFAINVHIMTLLACANDTLYTSDLIAGSLNINPVLVRKEISNLKKLGLVESKEGKNGGIKLMKPAHKISLSDILHASKEDHIFGYAKNEPNGKCPVGKQIICHLNTLFDEIDNEIDEKLRKITLKKFQELFT